MLHPTLLHANIRILWIEQAYTFWLAVRQGIISLFEKKKLCVDTVLYLQELYSCRVDRISLAPIRPHPPPENA